MGEAAATDPLAEPAPVSASALTDPGTAPMLPATQPDPIPAPTPSAADVRGTWTGTEGATHEITQTGRTAYIREISYVLFTPVETMNCSAEVEERASRDRARPIRA